MYDVTLDVLDWILGARSCLFWDACQSNCSLAYLYFNSVSPEYVLKKESYLPYSCFEGKIHNICRVLVRVWGLGGGVGV